MASDSVECGLCRCVPSDMQAANAVGLIAAGAAWGAEVDPVALKDSGAHVVFTRVSDFFNWLQPHLQR